MDCLSRIFLANGSSLVTCYLLAFFVLKCVCLFGWFFCCCCYWLYHLALNGSRASTDKMQGAVSVLMGVVLWFQTFCFFLKKRLFCQYWFYPISLFLEFCLCPVFCG